VKSNNMPMNKDMQAITATSVEFICFPHGIKYKASGLVCQCTP
jgi:hypothetical protein